MADAPRLRLYNTLTKAKEDFVPLDASNVRMYVCGPTVYDFAHIGNARPVIVFDVLFRLLQHLAKQGVWDGGKGETKVTYVRNITDIDDKINKRAFDRWTKKRPLLDEVRALTDVTTKQYEDDVAALGNLLPTHTPRATDFVCDGALPMDMVRVIEKLVDRGFAYVTSGHNSGKHVLFEVAKMENYGRLSRRSFDEMIVGAKGEVAPDKRSPRDFVLWKPSDPATEPGWDSPWGFGRPGWHIECSAMSGALLGEQFDIHAGGIDLIFPHHENEIAQTCCAFGVEKMASVWMHNGFLQVEGQKMSKSVGNFVTIDDLLQGNAFGGRSWPGRWLRLAMLRTHYRQPIDWTILSIVEASAALFKFDRAVGIRSERYDVPPPSALVEALCDDLNISAALEILHKLASEAMRYDVEERTLTRDYTMVNSDRAGRAADQLRAGLKLLGFEVASESLTLEQQRLIDLREAARAARNFAESDRIRDELLAMGIQLKDGKDPVTGAPKTTPEFKR
jgi:cysteinyl-tRNA synthetase